MKKVVRFLSICFFFLLAWQCSPVAAQVFPQYSWDTGQEKSKLTFVQALSGYGVTFTGHMDLFALDDADPNDLSGYYLRERGWFYLHRHKSYGLGFELNYEDSSGLNNDFLLVGARLSFNYKGAQLAATYFPYETDEGGQRFSLTGEYSLTEHSRLSLWGDYHVEDDAIISEAELSLAIFKKLWFDIEYRFNNRTELYGFGLGLSLLR
jgi:hypothetical protein